MAFAEADIDRAYSLVAALPPSFERTALLIRCARDMGTLSAAQVALESVDGLSEDGRSRLDQNAALARILASLRTTQCCCSRCRDRFSRRGTADDMGDVVHASDAARIVVIRCVSPRR